MFKFFIGIKINSHFKIAVNTEEVKRYNEITGEPYTKEINHLKAFLGNKEIPIEMFDGEISLHNLILGEDNQYFEGMLFDGSPFGTLIGCFISGDEDEDDYCMDIPVKLINDQSDKIKKKLASLDIDEEPKIYVYPR